MPEIQIVGIGGIQECSWAFVREIKYFTHAFQFFITKTISEVCVELEFFVEMLIRGYIKPDPETFPAIGCNPVEPGANLVIADIFITAADKSH